MVISKGNHMLTRRTLLKSILAVPFLPAAGLAKLVSKSSVKPVIPFEFAFCDISSYSNSHVHFNTPFVCSDAMIERLAELACQYPVSRITIEHDNAHWNQS